MSLRRSPTRTPAFLAANRRNALKSTGPRTARGKARTGFNALRNGNRSPRYQALWRVLMDAMPSQVDRVAAIVLTPGEAAHPLFADVVEVFREVDAELLSEYRQMGEARRAKSDGQSRNVL